MDITDISKVASRKRMNTEAEKLREKVSRETAKIIKLKVAQDTAYWDLKEKLQQVEGAHERLQQNMVEVQMQHEAISSHYQHELRLRPDTLNKVAGARDMCEVLEEYGERLRRGVARCRQDGAALAAAYRQCGARVRGLAQRRARLRDAARRATAAREADARRLGDALERAGALAAERREMAARLERSAEQTQRKDEATAALHANLTRSLREFEDQNTELKHTIGRLEKEVQELETAARAAEERERGASRAAAERATRLAGAERELAELRAHAREAELQQAQLHQALEEATTTNKDIKKLLSTHVDEIKSLEKIINDKTQRESDMEREATLMKQYICKLESEKLKLEEELKKMTQECSLKSATIEEMGSASLAAQSSLAAARAELVAQRQAHAAAADELRSAAAAKDRELDANSDTIARLMTDLKAESDARARAEAGHAALRRRADAELEAAHGRERALADSAARLDAAAKDKDAELSAQVALIMDGRAEQERLQQKIQGMQNTIDNIQKELTGRLAGPRAPDHDAPRRLDDAALYNFLSDGSVDGDALDPREVGRRFHALQRGAASRCADLQESISLSQMKDDLKIKSRTFFKNKRYDSKAKKLK